MWSVHRLDSLQQLQDPSQLTRLIREQALDIEGDLQQLQQFSQFFQQLTPRLGRAFVRLYRGCRRPSHCRRYSRQMLQLLQLKLQSAEQQLTALALEELHLSPVSAELRAIQH